MHLGSEAGYIRLRKRETEKEKEKGAQTHGCPALGAIKGQQQSCSAQLEHGAPGSKMLPAHGW